MSTKNNFFEERIVPGRFFLQGTAEVARALLGKILVRKLDDQTVLSGKIVETEAYLSVGDEASHSYRGKTARNAAMFENGGTLYVYKIYGIHYCINAVTEEYGKGSAVLIRALEPLSGISIMEENRGTQNIKKLCCGPGNLSKALCIDLSLNGTSLGGKQVYIIEAETSNKFTISSSKRVGITKSADLELRFFVSESPFVSAKR